MRAAAGAGSLEGSCRSGSRSQRGPAALGVGRGSAGAPGRAPRVQAQAHGWSNKEGPKEMAQERSHGRRAGAAPGTKTENVWTYLFSAQ